MAALRQAVAVVAVCHQRGVGVAGPRGAAAPGTSRSAPHLEAVCEHGSVPSAAPLARSGARSAASRGPAAD